jgi:ANTAR domain
VARHAINGERVFDMLRSHSQHNGRKVVDVAEAVVESHLLLLSALPSRRQPPARRGSPQRASNPSPACSDPGYSAWARRA